MDVAWACAQESLLPRLIEGSPLPDEPDAVAAERLMVEIHLGFLGVR